MMPVTMAGVTPWNRKKKPVALVATVVARKSAVQPSSRFAVSSPNRTTKPESIPTRLMTTWIRVNVVMLTQPSRHVERFASDPMRILRSDEHDRRRDVVGLTHTAQRRNGSKRLESLAESRRLRALGFNRSGVHRVDANFSRA